jgi:hypothetical protein
MKRILSGNWSVHQNKRKLSWRMKRKDEKMDELSLRPQLAGAC